MTTTPILSATLMTTSAINSSSHLTLTLMTTPFGPISPLPAASMSNSSFSVLVSTNTASSSISTTTSPLSTPTPSTILTSELSTPTTVSGSSSLPSSSLSSSSPSSSSSQPTGSAPLSSTSSTPTSAKEQTHTSTFQAPSVTTTSDIQLVPSSTSHEVFATTTFRSTFVVTVLDSTGGVLISTPSIFTAVVTSTAHNGSVVTVTEIGVNQTLSPNHNSSDKSEFFRNAGAVAGVFVLVGLAAASILLWIFFAVRRRRRNLKLDHDTAVSATLAAAGFHRTPLDDDDIDLSGSRRVGSEVNQRSSSGFAIGTTSSAPSGARTSAYMDSPHPDDSEVFNPYHDYVVPAGTSLPPVTFHNSPYRDRNGNGSGGRDQFVSHSASHSAGSYEPLLTSYYRPAPPPSPPSRTPPLIALSLGQSDPATTEPRAVPPSQNIGDDRLDPELRHRMTGEIDRASQRDLRDEEDYSRPVLGIRNLPDTTSQES